MSTDSKKEFKRDYGVAQYTTRETVQECGDVRVVKQYMIASVTRVLVERGNSVIERNDAISTRIIAHVCCMV